MELFINNVATQQRYFYARPYKTDIQNAEYRQMTLDGNYYFDIWIIGIPDGVSPVANETMIQKNSPRRLYIYSNDPLPENYLLSVDSIYGRDKYPLLELTTPCATLLDGMPPKECNFYATYNFTPPRIDSSFVEYRFVQLRHRQATNILYDLGTQQTYRLVLPKRAATLVLIMPLNFIRTTLKSGYFIFEDNNLIVRVYSKYFLSAARTEEDRGLVSVISTDDVHLMTRVTQFMSKLGIHSISKPSLNQIMGYDKYIKIIVGSVSNVYI